MVEIGSQEVSHLYVYIFVFIQGNKLFFKRQKHQPRSPSPFGVLWSP